MAFVHTLLLSLLFASLFSPVSNEALAQTYETPVFKGETSSGEKIYTQKVRVPVSSKDTSLEREAKITAAIEPSKTQVAGLAATRVQTETKTSTTEEKSGKKTKFKESFKEETRQKSDAIVTTQYTIDHEASSITETVILVEFKVNPNETVLASEANLEKRFQKVFRPHDKLNDGTTFIYTTYLEKYYFPVCLNKTQENSQKFMNKLCETLGFNESVKHTSKGPKPKILTPVDLGRKKTTWEGYISYLEENHPDRVHHFQCVDLWTDRLDPIDFDPRDLLVRDPEIRNTRGGDYFLTEIVCK